LNGVESAFIVFPYRKNRVGALSKFESGSQICSLFVKIQSSDAKFADVADRLNTLGE
jgi:hypothetical protein